MISFSVLTLFPDKIAQGLNYSIIGRAIQNNLIELNLVNIRDFAINDYGQVDDKLYGGGTGMLMMSEPILQAWLSIYKSDNKDILPDRQNELTIEDLQDERRKISHDRIIFLSPKGKTFNQKMAQELSKEENLVFLCGHYEGVDQRVLDVLQVEEISLGDFILTGGETAVTVMIDAIGRLIPGVLPNEEAHQKESHSEGLLEEAQYTRPAVWRGLEVPEILLSGHHEKIEKYRKSNSLLETFKKRPDLIQETALNEEEWLLLIDSLTNN